MPVIARFYGMIVKMYLLGKEHNPPHIHFLYEEYMGVLNIQTSDLLEGNLPTKAFTMAQEWTTLHRAELIEMWQTQVFKVLPPLE